MMLDARHLFSRGSFGALALAGLLAGCGGGAGPVDVAGLNYPRPHDYPIHGIDVSKFQGDIDWNKVADGGVKFAWIKASEGGDHADERFQANWEGAKAAGVPHGAYHFVYWCRPPMEEMAFFEQNAPVEPDALPPVLDVEATPTSHTCHRHLTQASAIRDMQIMLNEMERHYGKRPVIYTTVDFYRRSSPTAPSPTIRSGCARPNTIRRSGTATAPGGSGSTSRTAMCRGSPSRSTRDAFYGSREQWTAFLEGPNARPAAAHAPAEPAPTPALVEQAAAEPAPRPAAEPVVEALAPETAPPASLAPASAEGE